MINIVNLRVRSLDVNYNELSWQLQDTSEDLLDYDFQILRAEATAGPYDPISVTFQDRYIFRDSQVPTGHAYRVLYYLVRVTHRVTGETADFGPASKAPEEDLIGIEIKRHLTTLYREFTGRRCWVLPIRTFGQRCPSCWDFTLYKRKRSGCKTCFDTGFARGYHTPIETWVQIEPGTPWAEQNSNVGAMHQTNTSARLAEDIVKPRDLILEGENIRWRVTAVSDTEHSRVPVLIELQLHRIPSTDIEYSIPLNLPVPLRDLELTPPRQFTNPYSLSSLERDDSSILNVYTEPYKHFK